MEKVLFISNELFLDTKNREGGVRNCTLEFIELLSQRFEVVGFPVKTRRSLSYRAKVRLGLNHYDDYDPAEFREALHRKIKQNNIRFVFLNLSNTIRFSALIKQLPDVDVKVIVCSHGNETGDFLHQVVRFKESTGYSKKLFSAYTLGRLLKIEAFYRIKDIDMVWTVSPVEEDIEKWLGAKRTYMVPRVIKKDFLDLKPVLNRVGFLGDISHTPNQTGVLDICEALKRQEQPIELRLVGGPESIGESIAREYPFVTYLGYLEDRELREEAASWSYFLNLVFYYSRGVSTKLAKALSWGLPVITTIPGNRGYQWKEGELPLAKDAQHMAQLILANAGNIGNIERDQQEVKKILSSSPGFEQIMDLLYPQIMDL
ncbi:MAG TPA: glycosyltransferase [Puia sp.]